MNPFHNRESVIPSALTKGFGSNALSTKVVRIVDSSPEELSGGAKLYKCSECSFSSDHVKTMYGHMKARHKGFTIKRKREEIASAAECKKKKLVTVVYTPVELLRKGEKMYMCSACELTSDEIDSLYEHMENKHKGFTVKRKGDIAGSLWEEMELIYGKMPAGVQVLGANKVLGRVVTVIKTPIEQLNKGEKLFKCSACDLTSDEPTSLYHHMEVEHRNFTIERKGLSSCSDSTKRNDSVVDVEKQIGPFSVSFKRVDFDDGNDDENCRANYNDVEDNFFSVAGHHDDGYERVEGLNMLANASVRSESKCHESRQDLMSPSNQQSLERLVCNEKEVTTCNATHISDCKDKVVMVLENTCENKVHGGPAYKCSECGKTSQYPDTLYRHMKIKHQGFVIQKLSSDNNNAQSNKHPTGPGFVKIIKTSAELVLRGEKLYQCSLCNEGSNDTGDLYDHMKTVHKEYIINRVIDSEKISRPRNSDIGLNTVKILKSTPKEIANGAKPYKCSACDTCTDHMIELYKHMEEEHLDFVIKNMHETAKEHPTQIYPKQRQETVSVSLSKTVRAVAVRTRVGIRYKCSECGVIHIARHLVYKHAKKVHKNIPITYHTKNEPPRVHVLETRGENGPQYQCSDCSVTCEHKDTLIRHMRSQHKGCQIMDLNGVKVKKEHVDIDDKDLQRENAVIESGEFVEAIQIPVDEKGNQFKCSMCDKRTKNVAILYSHMRYQHTEYPILKKSSVKGIRMEFPRGTTDESIANENEKTVEAICIPSSLRAKKYKCSACHYDSNFTNNLYKHMRRCHKNLKILKKSDRVVKEDDGKSVWVVDIPGKKFHPYKCSQCNKTAADLKTLYGHMRLSHKGFTILRKDVNRKYVEAYRYKCSECDYMSNTTTSVYYHMEIEHEGFNIVKKSSRPSVSVDSDTTVLGSQNVDSSTQKRNLQRNTVCVLDNPVPGSDRYKCSLCNITSHSTGFLYRHMRRMHKDSEIIRRVVRHGVQKDDCDGTNKSAKNVYIVDIPKLRALPLSDIQLENTAHAIHVPTKTYYQYKCSECDRVSYNTDVLYRHMDRRHEGLIIKKDICFAQKKDVSIEDKEDLDNEGTLQMVDENINQSSTFVDHEESFVDKINVAHQVGISNGTDSGALKESVESGTNEFGEGASIVEEHECDGPNGKNNTVQIIAHQKVRNFHFKCSACGKTSDYAKTIHEHIKLKHKNLKIMKEADVKLMKMLRNSKSNDQGIVGVNENIEQAKKTVQIVKNPVAPPHRYQCSECNQTSATTGNLYSHMRLKHSGFRIVGRINNKKTMNSSIYSNEGHVSDMENPESNNWKGTSDDAEEDGLDIVGTTKTVHVVDIPFVEPHRFKCSNCDQTSDSCGLLYDHMERDHSDLHIIKPTETKIMMARSEHNETPDYEMACAYEDDDSDKEIYDMNEKNGEKPGNNSVDCNPTLDLQGNSQENTVRIIDIPKVGNHRYKCSMCKTTSGTTGNLYKHMRLAHRGYRIVKKSDKIKDIDVSGNSNDVDDNGDWSAVVNEPECAEVESIKRTVHIIEVTKVGKDCYKCSKCNATSHCTSDLYKHMKVKHKGYRIVKKPAINGISSGRNNSMDVNFDGRDKIVQIIDIDKQGGQRYKCSLCNQTSAFTGNLYKHMRNVHKGFRIIRKTDKSLSFSEDCMRTGNYKTKVSASKQEKFSVERNEKVVQVLDIPGKGTYRYKCSECDRLGSDKGILYTHMKLCHKGYRIVKDKERMNENSFGISKHVKKSVSSEKNNGSSDFSSSRNVGEQSVDIDSCGIENQSDNEDVEDETKNVIYDDDNDHANESEQINNQHPTEEHTRPDVVIDDDLQKEQTSGIQNFLSKIRCYECSGCMAMFSSLDDLDKHVGSHSCEQRSGDVTDCDEIDEFIYSKHEDKKTIVHIVDIPILGNHRYKCSMCDMTANSTSRLYRHMRSKHRGCGIVKKSDMTKEDCSFVGDLEGLFSCDTNMDQTSTVGEKDSLHGERIVQIVDIPMIGNCRYKCSKCDKIGSTTGNLYKHMRSIHKGYRVVKKTDGKIKIRKPDVANVDTSSNFVEQERKNFKGTVYVVDIPKVGNHRYKCSKCSRTGSTTTNLYRHMRLYHKRYKIIKKTDIVKRTEVDSEEGYLEGEGIREAVYILDIPQIGNHRYKCSMCDTTGSTTSNLYKHMKLKHRRHKIIKKADMKQDSSVSAGHNIKKPVGDDMNMSSIANEQGRSKEESHEKTVYIIDIPKVGNHRYKCSRCNMTSYSTYKLYKHMKSEHRNLRIVRKGSSGSTENILLHSPVQESNMSKTVQNEISSEHGMTSEGEGKATKDKSFNEKSDEDVIVEKGHLIQMNTVEDSFHEGASMSQDNKSVCDESYTEIQSGQTQGTESFLSKISYYECSGCMAMFSSLDDLDKHVGSHSCEQLRSKTSEDITDCDEVDECEYSDDEDNEAVVHIVEIPKVGNHRYKCSMCDMTSRGITKLYKHMRSIHTGCRIFKKEFDEKGSDFSDVESGEDMDSSSVHIVDFPKRPNGQRYKCSKCGKKSTSTNNLYKHMRIHHEGLKILRKIDKAIIENGGNNGNCDKGDDTKTVRVKGIPKVRNRRYKCTKCNTTCRTVSNLYKHVRLIHRGYKIIKKTDVMKDDVSGILRHVGYQIVKKADALKDKAVSGVENNKKIASDEMERSHGRDDIVSSETRHTKEESCGERTKVTSSSKGSNEGRFTGMEGAEDDAYFSEFCDSEGNNVVENKHIVCPDMETIPVTVSFENGDEQSALKTGSRTTVEIIDIPKQPVTGHMYKCSLCNKTSSHTGNLYNHMRYHHDTFQIVQKTDKKKKDKGSRCQEWDSVKVNVGNLNENQILKTEFCNAPLEDVTAGLEKNRGQNSWCETIDRPGIGTHTNQVEKKIRKGNIPVVYIIDIPNGGNYKYKCSECNLPSHHTGNLYKHMRRVHKGFRIVKKTDASFKNLPVHTEALIYESVSNAEQDNVTSYEFHKGQTFQTNTENISFTIGCEEWNVNDNVDNSAATGINESVQVMKQEVNEVVQSACSQISIEILVNGLEVTEDQEKKNVTITDEQNM